MHEGEERKRGRRRIWMNMSIGEPGKKQLMARNKDKTQELIFRA